MPLDLSELFEPLAPLEALESFEPPESDFAFELSLFTAAELAEPWSVR